MIEPLREKVVPDALRAPYVRVNDEDACRVFHAQRSSLFFCVFLVLPRFVSYKPVAREPIIIYSRLQRI